MRAVAVEMFLRNEAAQAEVNINADSYSDGGVHTCMMPASFDAADRKVEINESLSVVRECCVCQTPLRNLCHICELT